MKGPNAQPVETETAFVKHIRVDANIEILVDGQTSHGVVFKRERQADGMPATEQGSAEHA